MSFFKHPLTILMMVAIAIVLADIFIIGDGTGVISYVTFGITGLIYGLAAYKGYKNTKK